MVTNLYVYIVGPGSCPSYRELNNFKRCSFFKSARPFRNAPHSAAASFYVCVVSLIACRVKNLMEKRFNKSVKWSCRFFCG